MFDAATGASLPLLERLQEQGTIDQIVGLGAKARMPVRLVAHPVSAEVAAARREEANRDRRAKHSAEYLALLGWEIFITNVPNTRSTTQVCQANTSSWRIETVFKSWKSHFTIDEVPNGDAPRVRTHLLVSLILVTLFQTCLFLKFAPETLALGERDLSIMKVTQFLQQHAWLFFATPMTDENKELLRRQILYHCRYDKRTRPNFTQKFRAFG